MTSVLTTAELGCRDRERKYMWGEDRMPWGAKAVPPPPELSKDKGRFLPGDIRETPSNAWKIPYLTP